MKREQVERLAALLARATPGPWQALNEYQWDTIIGDIDGPDDGEMHYELATDITSHHARSRSNAELIVAAVNALPALLQLAKAVSEAPVGEVAAQGWQRFPKGEPHNIVHVTTESREKWPNLSGQRVRLVPAGEGKDG